VATFAVLSSEHSDVVVDASKQAVEKDDDEK
jgi:hypothetical protein